MAMERGKLADIQTIDDSAASVYTNAASTKTYIRSIWLHNTNGTSETVALYNVPDSTGSPGTAADSNRFFSKAIAAGETFALDLLYPIVLQDEGDSLQAVTDTASKVTIQILGDKETA